MTLIAVYYKIKINIKVCKDNINFRNGDVISKYQN